MRVISGRAKGRKLKKVPGDTTRPIMDRVKESLFNILGNDVAGTRWLDLFAGTGQVGIEALSRGAAWVVFVDSARQAVQTVKENLRHTALAAEATVVQGDAFRYLEMAPHAPFDVIYVAPPQYQGLWRQVVLGVEERPSALLMPDGIVIVQIDPREDDALPLVRLVEYDRRRYGNTLLLFYEQAPD
ncbi:MAG: 16S rRNA (guanine(966)-N(2))-methyltransferase RsmD [Anaerolineales bacterium]|nr:16S rRNA (guanine(966)-N(2))-methyltransferase RsmD [Anaerolineales bacterium]